MKVGYARVSTPEQNLEVQTEQLKKYGCEKIYSDVASGVKTNRAGLDELMKFVRAGDEIVVVRLDRLGRSLRELVQLVNQLKEQDIQLISLAENIDTTTSTGQLVFNIFASLADFERNLIIDRTQAGLQVARARGRFGGRPRLLSKSQVTKMLYLYDSRQFPVADIAKEFKVSVGTLYRYLEERKIQQ